VQQDLGFDSRDEGKITAVGVQGKDSCHSRSSSNNESHDDERKRNELFHKRVVSKHTNIVTLFDPGSQVNLLSEELVKKMGLETKPHLKPYPLGWVCDKEKLNVTKQCRVRFAIDSKLIDKVDFDVVSFVICGIVLGSPYLYDKKVLFHPEKKYHLTKGGVEYIVRAHSMRVNTTLVSARQMKRLINTNKRYAPMAVREKYVGTSYAFQGCDPSHKKELVDIVSKCDDIFQESEGLPPKREIQHQIHLQQDSPLPNVGMYRMSIVDMTEIKKQVQGLLYHRVIMPNSSPCGSPIVMVPKKDGTWRMCVDNRALNKIMVKNRYPLPCIDDLLDQLKNVVYFTKLDLCNGYHQIRVA
jgi:hypothetical protein